MTDLREDILARLAAVCGAVTGVASTTRNRLDVSRLQRPAVVILDGAEQLLDAPATVRHSEVQRMELAPIVSIHIRGTDAGGLLSLYRSRLLAAILTDATLDEYVSPNGGVRYEGSTVAAPAAEGSEYRIDMAVVFTYPFRVADLVG